MPKPTSTRSKPVAKVRDRLCKDDSRSQTEKRINLFFDTLDTINGADNPLTTEEKCKLKEFISRSLQQERPNDSLKSWIDYCHPMKLLHNMLLDAGLDQYEARSGVFIGSTSIGATLCGENNLRRKKRNRRLDACFLKRLRDGCNRIEKGSFLPSIFIPINLGLAHWGYIIAISPSTVREDRKVYIYFGDSLRWRPPKGLLATTKAYLSEIFSDIEWVVRSENHALDILHYGKQSNAYSCGFYVLSAASTLSVSRGVMPEQTMASGRDVIAEQYRNACIRALVTTVLRVVDRKGEKEASDFDVLSFMATKRNERYTERSLRKSARKLELPRASTGLKSDRDKSLATVNRTEESDVSLQGLWGDEEESSDEDVDVLPSLSRGHNHLDENRSRLQIVGMKGCDITPSASAQNVCTKNRPRTTHADVKLDVSSVHGIDIAPKLKSPLNERKPVEDKKQKSRPRLGKKDVEEQHVENLVTFVGQLFDEGHHFGRVYTTVYKRKHRKEYIGKTRLRCLSYGKNTKCPSQIIARYRRDGTGWTVSALLEHDNHGRNSINSKRTKEKQTANLETSIARHFGRMDKE